MLERLSSPIGPPVVYKQDTGCGSQLETRAGKSPESVVLDLKKSTSGILVENGKQVPGGQKNGSVGRQAWEEKYVDHHSNPERWDYMDEPWYSISDME